MLFFFIWLLFSLYANSQTHNNDARRDHHVSIFFWKMSILSKCVCVYVCMSFSHFISLFFGLCFNVRKNTFNDLHINTHTHTFIQHSGHHQLAKNWLYGFVNGSVVCVYASFIQWWWSSSSSTTIADDIIIIINKIFIHK